MNHDPGSIPGLTYSGSEKGPFIYHLQALHNDAQVGSMPLKLQDIMRDIVKSHASETRVNKSYGT
jgi:hypothetical protein